MKFTKETDRTQRSIIVMTYISEQTEFYAVNKLYLLLSETFSFLPNYRRELDVPLTRTIATLGAF